MNKLLEWKESKNRKPLLLTGVRQCGKTYSMKEFGSIYFKDTAYLNLEENAQARDIFEYDYDVNRIIKELETIILERKIEEGNTLLIFDEIQECPRAITSLKYFCENMPNLHIIAAGSLLGVKLMKLEKEDKGFSFPVGKVDRVTMYPMSFKEFVMADDGEKYIQILENYALERSLPDSYMDIMSKYLKNYYIVGGMPASVQSWIDDHNYGRIDEIQGNILRDYEADFSKHAPISQVPKLHWIWDSIPNQIARENNKFVFSHVKAGKRASDLEDALQWLISAGLIYTPKMVNHPVSPLKSNCDSSYFKVYMADVGLLRRKAEVSYRMILEDRLSSGFKGALAENYVEGELVKKGFNPYFYRSGNTAEVDFILEKDGYVYPMEVKYADNTRAKSFVNYLRDYRPKRGFKCSLKNVSKSETKENVEFYTLPLFLMYRIEKYL
ncbi:MAG: ATP-binding protein [Faecalicoccus sp.]|nr:ATP-binding protein [Faecalicoccus sp.]